jgi:hypothetical protein
MSQWVLLPSWNRRGGCAVKKYREATFVRADGVVRPAKWLGLNVFAELTTPSAANQWLRDILIYAAATPPMLGGESLTAVQPRSLSDEPDRRFGFRALFSPQP